MNNIKEIFFVRIREGNEIMPNEFFIVNEAIYCCKYHIIGDMHVTVFKKVEFNWNNIENKFSNN